MSETTGEKVYSGIAEYGKIRAGIGLVVGGFICIIFLLIGIYMVSRKEIHTLRLNTKIEKASCSLVHVSGKNKQLSYSCDLTVKYTVDGKEYTYEGIKNSVQQYLPGSSIDVYVDPTNPSDATFDSGLKWLGWILIAISLFIIILVGGNFYLTTRYKGYAAFTGASGVASAFGSMSHSPWY